MSDCPFYALHQQQLASNEIRADRQRSPGTTASIPHCTHPNSPAPLQRLLRVMGAAHVLTCGGDLAKCQLPAEQR